MGLKRMSCQSRHHRRHRSTMQFLVDTMLIIQDLLEQKGTSCRIHPHRRFQLDVTVLQIVVMMLRIRHYLGVLINDIAITMLQQLNCDGRWQME